MRDGRGVVYIVGGPARAGKTTLGERLRAAADVSVISTDALIWSIAAVTPELGIGFGAGQDPGKVLAYLGPFLYAATNWGQFGFALEGVGFGPEHLGLITADLPDTVEVRACFLVHTTATTADLTIGGGWLAHETYDEFRDKVVESLRAVSVSVAAKCGEHGVACFDIAQGREEALTAAVDHLLSSDAAVPRRSAERGVTGAVS